jgi:hypothetical protein
VSTPKAVPIDPISGILEAFRSHRIVALGDGLHGNEQSQAFRLALIRDSRFALTVNDIVVEFGSARYQDVVDRFVAGAEVGDGELAHVWQDVAQSGYTFDSPVYADFIRAVRSVNLSLPRERRLRVLLGDPPIEWEKVKSSEDLGAWIAKRDSHPAALIRNEVLAKNRRALVIYGDGHLRRDNEWARDAAGHPFPTLTGLIEQDAKVFSIWSNTTVQLERMQADIASWKIPSLTILTGTRLGTLNFRYYAGRESSKRMEDEYDAVLYLGPVSSISEAELSPALCADPAYVKMRLGRLSLAPPGAAKTEMDRFKEYCARRLEQRQHRSPEASRF